MKNFAFTLAEVLITLGIIGVVASMTLPTVINKYKKQVIGTKLAKFYSVMNQALERSKAEKGELTFEQEMQNDSEYLTAWYRDNITKYIKTIYEEGPDKNRAYYKAIFLDGSGFNSYYSGTKPDGSGGLGNLYIFYCIDYKSCKNGSFDGINTFLFIALPAEARITTYGVNSSHSQLVKDCGTKDRQWGCATLIMQNGWKVPDDYPLLR